jgi:hypothetical protein
MRNHDFADLIPNGLKEIADVQRITSFRWDARFVPIPAQGLELLDEFGVG